MASRFYGNLGRLWVGEEAFCFEPMHLIDFCGLPVTVDGSFDSGAGAAAMAPGSVLASSIRPAANFEMSTESLCHRSDAVARMSNNV